MAPMICYAIVVLLSSALTFTANTSDARDYIPLITDVHEYYGTTCIIIANSDRRTDFNEIASTHLWSRAFSRRGILVTVTSFSELTRQAERYQGYVARPLCVVLLTASETMDEFAMAIGQIDVSFPVWLLMFLPYRGNPLRGICRQPVGNPFDLTFDTEMLVLCYDLPILREWYASRDNRTRVFDLATWKSGERSNFNTRGGLFARRSNMFGETLSIAIVRDSPFVKLKDGVLSLFLGEVVRELSNSMNFTMKVARTMTAYGSWNKEERSWTGVIGEVAANKVDIGVAEFSMTDRRLDVVDFTLPLILSRNRIYFRRPDDPFVYWSAYFKTFRMDVWMAIISVVVSAPILLTVIKTRGRVTMKILVDNYMHVWGIYCQQGLSEFPKESSIRLAFLSIFVSALIIQSIYSASLISFLTVSTFSLPFSTIEEFIAHGSYKLIVFKNSADYDMIISTNRGVFSKLKKLLKRKQDLPSTVNDGFLQVCSENVGFYVTEVLRDSMSSAPCGIVHIDAGRVDSLALVLNKGSPYTGLINYHLQRFEDNGVLNKLRNTFLMTISSRDKGYVVVSLADVAPILAVLASGIIFSCLVLLLEKTYYNLWDKKYREAYRSVLWKNFFQRDLAANRRRRRRTRSQPVKDAARSSEKRRSRVDHERGARYPRCE